MLFSLMRGKLLTLFRPSGCLLSSSEYVLLCLMTVGTPSPFEVCVTDPLLLPLSPLFSRRFSPACPLQTLLPSTRSCPHRVFFLRVALRSGRASPSSPCLFRVSVTWPMSLLCASSDGVSLSHDYPICVLCRRYLVLSSGSLRMLYPSLPASWCRPP